MALADSVMAVLSMPVVFSGDLDVLLLGDGGETLVAALVVLRVGKLQR